MAGQQGRAEGVFPGHVPGQAGFARQAAGPGLFSGQARAGGQTVFGQKKHIGPVGHFQHVGHVARHAQIQDGHGHVGLHHVQHGGCKPARVQGHGFARLQIDLRMVTVPPVRKQAAEQVQVVVRPGDVVPAAHVDPAALGQPGAEFFLHGGQGALQGVGVLLAKGMEMQAGDALQSRGVKIFAPDAQARPRRAGVVDGRRALGMLRIDPQPALDTPVRTAALIVHGNGGAKLPPLSRGIEHQVVCEGEQLGHFARVPGGGKGVHLPAKRLPRQAGLVHRAGAGPPQGARTFKSRQQRKGGPGRKALERQQDSGSGALLHLVQHGDVGAQAVRVQHKAGCGHAPGVKQDFRAKEHGHP